VAGTPRKRTPRSGEEPLRLLPPELVEPSEAEAERLLETLARALVPSLTSQRRSDAGLDPRLHQS
jgi:hypothetical protein